MERTTLEYYKKNIDLVEFARSYGFEIVKNKTSKNSVFLKNLANDKIIVSKSKQDHYIYLNLEVSRDKGSIIDFILNRNNNINIPQCRTILQQFENGETTNKKPISHYELSYQPGDLESVKRQFSKLEPFTNKDYMLSRGFSNELLNSRMLQGRIFNETYTKDNISYINTAFPLFGEYEGKTQILGYERRNANFRGVAEGSMKFCSGWVSAFDKKEKVISLFSGESPIDCLSHAQLFGNYNNNNIYYSYGGEITSGNIDQIKKIFVKYNPNKLLLGGDNDPSGQMFNAKILAELDCPEILINRDYINKNRSLVHPDIKLEKIDPHTGQMTFKLSNITYLASKYDDLKNIDNVIKLLTEGDKKLQEYFLDMNIKLKGINTENEPFKIQDQPATHVHSIKINFNSTTDNWHQIALAIHNLKYGFSEKIEIHRSQGKDFNEDLQNKHRIKPDINITSTKTKQHNKDTSISI